MAKREWKQNGTNCQAWEWDLIKNGRFEAVFPISFSFSFFPFWTVKVWVAGDVILSRPIPCVTSLYLSRPSSLHPLSTTWTYATRIFVSHVSPILSLVRNHEETGSCDVSLYVRHPPTHPSCVTSFYLTTCISLKIDSSLQAVKGGLR